MTWVEWAGVVAAVVVVAAAFSPNRVWRRLFGPREESWPPRRRDGE